MLKNSLFLLLCAINSYAELPLPVKDSATRKNLDYLDNKISKAQKSVDSLYGTTLSTGSGTVPIAHGGTGATTAASARANLGVPSLTGDGASGTWNIGILGNAATVTNGVYTTGSYSDPAWLTSLGIAKIDLSTVTSVLNAHASTLSTAVYNTNFYADPTWITSLATTKLTSLGCVGGQFLGWDGVQWICSDQTIQSNSYMADDLSASVDGTRVEFYLSSTPATNSLIVFKNGVGMDTGDYSITANTVTFVSPPYSGTKLIGKYAIGGISQIQVSTWVYVAPITSNETLGQGATFYAFNAPVSGVELVKLSLTTLDPGENGSTDWRCGYGAAYLQATTTDLTPIGSVVEATGVVPISAGNTVTCLIVATTQDITPTANLEIMYRRQ